VYGAQPHHVIRGRKFIEIPQYGERIGDAGRGRECG
jgi:hypothetical protein